jgi:hypothetical protein
MNLARLAKFLSIPWLAKVGFSEIGVFFTPIFIFVCD